MMGVRLASTEEVCALHVEDGVVTFLVGDGSGSGAMTFRLVEVAVEPLVWPEDHFRVGRLEGFLAPKVVR